MNHEISKTFDCDPSLEVRSVFLDIPKAFEKPWHIGLFYKIKPMSISHRLYELIENYLSGRFQRVILNGETSSQRPFWQVVLRAQFFGPTSFSHLS